MTGESFDCNYNLCLCMIWARESNAIDGSAVNRRLLNFLPHNVHLILAI